MSRYAFSLGLVDFPNSRSSHTSPTPRGGGVGLLLAFFVVSVFLTHASESLWLPATFLALVSFFDDRLDLSPRARLLFQLGAAAIMVLGAGVNEFSYLDLIFIPFWLLFIVGTANFYNFMDGINGIAGITGVVGFGLAAAFIRIVDADSTLFFLSLAMSAACAGFLPFNLPKARVFMGDVGSILLGFVFAGITFTLSNDLGSFLCFLAFMFPFYADALSTLFVRWRDGEKLTQAHRCHLYQVLANDCALPHWLVSCGYGFVQLVVGITMLWAWNRGLWNQLVVLALCSVIFMGFTCWVRKKVS
ncbi:glycosyltransferase family 4 protein [Desulfopila sp. IMCC35006]|uniref:MraY family glycosyltransferase n=1 Tax=Desulfopila sp. IMCC35006 TaxID=2569542 RepID=UPI00142EFF3C|nr:glycosyltransferase family 4 protein [Desulfopila sp. IMCC35006]